ncbi:MAG TPA: peptidylprolyl isomerase [Bacillota bacterium]|nr:peptidylprolyl isomerase [Bacillota bacterium]
MKKFDKSYLTLAVLVLALVGLVIWQQQTHKEEAVATVNGKAITKSNLYDQLVKQDGSQALDQLITDQLIEQEAAKKGIQVSDKDITAELDKLQKQVGSQDAFNKMLAQNHMTLEDAKDQLKKNLVIKKLFADKIKISDQDVRSYFDQNKEKLGQPEQVRASHILVKTEEEAKAIKKQLANGANFEQLAKEKSTDPGSKDKGGDLGYFTPGKMVPEFDKVAFSLKPGEISDVVKTDFGYHIIKVIDKKPAVAANFEDNKEKIQDLLFNQKLNEQLPAWMDELHKKAKITNKLEG